MLESKNIGLSPPTENMLEPKLKSGQSRLRVDQGRPKGGKSRYLLIGIETQKMPVTAPPEQPLIIDLVERGDIRYSTVCEDVVRKVYSNDVKILLDEKYFSPLMITVFDHGKPVGAIGMTRGGEEPLLSELLCPAAVEKELEQQGITDMRQVAEFGCMSLLEEHRHLIQSLVKEVLNYAYRTGINYGIMTFGAHVRRHLRDRSSGKYMPMQLLDANPVPPPEVAELWAVRYANTRPACYGTVMKDAVQFWKGVEMPAVPTTSTINPIPIVKTAKM